MAAKRSRYSVQEYLDTVGGFLEESLDCMHYDSNRWEVEFIWRRALYPQILQTEEMLIVRASFIEPFSPLIGFVLQAEMNEESRWRAAVMLLAFSIQCPVAKPWMVISDLKEKWEFAWMDGLNMYVSGASSWGQGRGIFRDLVRDFHTLLDPRAIGDLSGLPSPFDRRTQGV